MQLRYIIKLYFFYALWGKIWLSCSEITTLKITSLNIKWQSVYFLGKNPPTTTTKQKNNNITKPIKCVQISVRSFLFYLWSYKNRNFAACEIALYHHGLGINKQSYSDMNKYPLCIYWSHALIGSSHLLSYIL